MTVRSRIMRTGAALLAAVALAACGSGGTTTPSSNTTVSGTTPPGSSSAAITPAATSAGTPQANATESNPAGDIPDTQAFVDYTPTAGVYSVQVPEGWARTETGTSTLFSDKYNSILIETAAAPSAPTVQSGPAEMAKIGSAAKGFTPGDVTPVQRTAGTAVLITYKADSAQNAVTGKVVSQDVERYEFWNNGTLVALTLSAPVGSDNVDPWRTVTDSFRWTP